MKLKCKYSMNPNTHNKKRINDQHYSDFDGFLVINQEYVVYGLSIIEGLILVDILSQSETYLIPVPIDFFEIIDNCVSKYWEVSVKESGAILFWPHSFYTPSFHDRLSDGVPEIVEEFMHIKDLIEKENIII